MSVSNNKNNYPVWHCPVFLCSFSSCYAKNIGQHLRKVHGWDDFNIQVSLDHFFEGVKEGVDRINKKDPRDPTNPVHWLAMIVSSEGDHRSPERFLGGGGGG